MLLVHNGARQAKPFKGALQLVVKTQQHGKDVMIAFPSENERNAHGFSFEIKRFQRLEGVFSIPVGAVVKSVEARVLQDGVLHARQSLNL